MKNFFLIFIFSIFIVSSAYAQVPFYIYPEDNLRGQVDPSTGLSYEPPPEPSIPKIKYMQYDQPQGLQQQIDQLVQGITVPLPPEYDYYGYEMRRYMAHVGGKEIYKDKTRLEDELSNARKAEIVYEYWVKDLQKKMKNIEAAIDEQNASSTLRSTYNYNRGVISAFEIECKAWLDANIGFLEFLSENPQAYTFDDPYLTFKDGDAKATLDALYQQRTDARARINKYQPFAFMVY